MSGFNDGFNEVIPGVQHWQAFHERIRQNAHSYYLTDTRVAIDPMPGENLVEELEARGGVERVLLTNRHHLRGAETLVEAFGCTIHAPAPGMHEFGSETTVRPYEWGEELAHGVTAHEVGAICPDDGALHVAPGPGAGALALADSVISSEGGLAFVPDFLMDEPDRVKAATTAALERLLGLEFDAILLAHGEPISSGGTEILRGFIAEPRQAKFEE